jgi:hypothetical protein
MRQVVNTTACTLALLLSLQVGTASAQTPDAPDEPGAPGAALPAPPTSLPSTPPTEQQPPSAAAPEEGAPVPWYYLERGVRGGPVSADQLRQMVHAGTLSAYTMVWQPGYPGWTALGSLAEFADLRHLPPPGARFDRNKRRPMRGLAIAGGITFAASWGLAALMSIILAGADDCSDCDEVSKVMWIPIAGPLIADQVDDSEDNEGLTTLMALWSITQVAGATLFTIGMIGKRPDPQQSVHWQVTPLFGRLNGFGVSGSF